MNEFADQPTDLESPDDIALADRMKAGREQILVELRKKIIGQQEVINETLLTLLVGGNSLIIGVPGLAKTLLIQTMAQVLDLKFSRIQFTPDLMPSDITGTDIIQEDAATGGRKMVFAPGPVFTNVLLADEINRTPPKTQSALLEAMQEHRVTVQGRTYTLEEPFFVFATQNPIELEGTYPLPEAQLDRFLMHVFVDYPDADGEHAILELNRAEAKRSATDAELFQPQTVLTQADILAARQDVLALHLSEPLEKYIVQIVLATRKADRYGDDLQGLLQYGASPRATIALDRCARAHAWLSCRDYVTPEDIQSVAHDVLRHRILLSFEAEAAGQTPDQIVDMLVSRIGVP